MFQVKTFGIQEFDLNVIFTTSAEEDFVLIVYLQCRTNIDSLFTQNKSYYFSLMYIQFSKIVNLSHSRKRCCVNRHTKHVSIFHLKTSLRKNDLSPNLFVFFT